MNNPIPKTVGVAVQLLALAAIVFVLFMVAHFTIMAVSSPPAIFKSALWHLCDTITYITIVTVSLVGIFRGRRWARLLYVAYVGIRFTVLYSAHDFSSTNALIDLIVIGYWIIVVIGVTLLFSPESNCYFNDTEQPPLSDNMKRPLAVGLAMELQLVNLLVFVAGAVAAFFFYRSIGQPLWYLSVNSTISLLIDTPCHLIIMAVLITAIYRQNAWARIVFTIYVIYRLLFHFYTIHYMTYPKTIELLVYAFHFLNFASLTLLYCPSGNFWFKHVKKSLRRRL